ncbi:hypothetical protein WJX81_003060 [Elliptochloris bilobata]|uniref:Threonylcarbamoyl-AMP synthase n=1 Tax=Elliptochloris bilobata TaxID=381761 RepID=A0AAW1S0M6_9CHLO
MPAHVLQYSTAAAQLRPPRCAAPLLVTVDPYGSDTWRLDPIIALLREGALGIIPTDSFPALVCDVDARQAVERLYAAKDMAPTKQLSIMCRSFADVAEYTLGFPAPQPGRPDAFRLARQALPGPYTLILHASKRLPKQCVDYLTGKAKQRRTVGVRLPGDPICQAVLAGLERPLLCSSVHVEAGVGALELPEAAVMLDMFEPRGIDFVVDAGVTVAEGSTIIDLTGRDPELLRAGKGDAGVFLPDPVYA